MKTYSRIFTLSVYDRGAHRISGRVSSTDKKYSKKSFAESLSPLTFMINEIKAPLGTKIRVTMEVLKGINVHT